MHRIANGKVTYPHSFTNVAMPMNNVEINSKATSAGWFNHSVYSRTLTYCYVSNADASDYNNLLVIGY